jgi:hypothetical protein
MRKETPVFVSKMSSTPAESSTWKFGQKCRTSSKTRRKTGFGRCGRPRMRSIFPVAHGRENRRLSLITTILCCPPRPRPGCSDTARSKGGNGLAGGRRRAKSADVISRSGGLVGPRPCLDSPKGSGAAGLWVGNCNDLQSSAAGIAGRYTYLVPFSSPTRFHATPTSVSVPARVTM